MYVQRLDIENIGPIARLQLDFPLNDDNTPKPVVFVGQNGAGKSIVLSHIVNALLDMKGVSYEDKEVEEGKVFKLRSPIYIRHGTFHSYAKVTFSNSLYQSELQITSRKSNFVGQFGYKPDVEIWDRLEEDGNSIYDSNFQSEADKIKNDFQRCSYLYFPPNRFEDPAWLNKLNLLNTAKYTSLNMYKGFSNKTIINYSPLKDNQDFLLDILYDSYAIERKIHMYSASPELPPFPKVEQAGPATSLRTEIEKFLRVLLNVDGPISWVTGQRGNRSISIHSAGAPLISNLFALSTGQTSLLNMFLTLIRQSDLCSPKPPTLADIEGIVIVDEIDVHLHTDLQYKILPNLVSLFPKVQFVVTSHSPLFALGLAGKISDSGFALINLPEGIEISPERYQEFLTAYDHFKKTTYVSGDIAKAIADSHKPLLFVEGQIDVELILHAAELLGRPLDKWRVLDGEGYGGLDKIWRHFDNRVALGLSQLVMLLYDCDIKKTSEDRGNLKRRVMASRPRKLTAGIENMFPDDLIERAFGENPQFFDHTPAVERTVRGNTVRDDERWAVNKDEKRNLAAWLIANASKADFEEFSQIFDMIEAFTPCDV